MDIFRHPPERRTLALLAECGLPAGDLTAADLDGFLGCGREDEPDGVVGLELHGAVALLRSLAVTSGSRDRGCGKALVSSAERLALSCGVQTVYLLTETAESFFAGLGYERVARDVVPDAIRETAEFSRLCPDSAAVMKKDLRDAGSGEKERA